MTPARAQQLLLLRDSTPSTVNTRDISRHMTEAEREAIGGGALAHAMTVNEFIQAIADGEIVRE